MIRGLNNLHIKEGSVVTIGVFDGMHIGHRKIIGDVVKRAKALGLASAAVTFDPHPLKVLSRGHAIPSLISLDHRIRLIKECGLDILVVLKFTKAVSSLSAEDFVKDILVDRMNAREIYVGGDFYFGKGRKAGPTALKALAKRHALKVRVVKPVKASGRVVSSSLIRKLIAAGELRKAAKFLARPVSVLGTVVSGANLARELGYPTANLNPHHEAIPPSGVYACLVRYGKKFYKGILNIGTAPTFYSPRDREPAIEVHIFDFRKDVYGKDLEVLFIGKLRDEKRFKDKDTLVAEIEKDEKAARKILNLYKSGQVC